MKYVFYKEAIISRRTRAVYLFSHPGPGTYGT